MQPFIRVTLAVSVLLGLVWMVALVWLRYPDNHGGGPGTFGWYFFIVLVAALAHGVGAAKAPLLAIALASTGLIATWIADERNIIVEYEEWIRRGMPEWGTPKRSAEWDKEPEPEL